SGYVPPDTQVAAGPNHVVEAVNGRLAIYSKAGVQLSSQALNSFFNSGSASLGDPVVGYDDLANRFVVGTLQVSSTTSFWDLAVSDSSDPTAGFTDKQKIDIK